MKKLLYSAALLFTLGTTTLAGQLLAQTGTMMIDSAAMGNAMRSPAPAFVARELTMMRMQMQSTGTATFSVKPIGKSAHRVEAKVDAKQVQAVRSAMMVGPGLVDGSVLIEALASADNDTLIRELTAAGATDVQVTGSLVHAKLPVANILRLSTMTSARFVRPMPAPLTNSGPANSQGDMAQKSDSARTRFNVSGVGVKVGVISDSYDRLGGASKGVATGELPGVTNPFGYKSPVQVLREGVDRPSFSDEGRAMMEIVHDIAPGAALAFYSPFGVQGHAKGIYELAAAGAAVIVDDVTYPSEPWFQPSPIATAARDVALRHNTVVITSAGNRERKSLEGNFKPTPAKDLLVNGVSIGRSELHDFGGGRVTVPIFFAQGFPLSLGLQWNDRFATFSPDKQGSATDLDFYFFADEEGTDAINGSNNENVGSDPVEFSTLVTRDGEGSNVIYVGIGRRVDTPKADGVQFKLVGFDSANPGFNTLFPKEFFTRATITGHASSRWIITSCAANYRNPQAATGALVEPYSSLGGIAQLRDERGNPLPVPIVVLKPDVCSPSGVNNSFFGGGPDPENDGFPNFGGTSASAPHAAGVAALMIEAANYNLPALAINYVFKAAAVDMDDPLTPQFDAGVDFRTGAGFLDASRAVNIASFFKRFPRIQPNQK